MSSSARTARRGPRSAWDWFPWAVWTALIVVIAVNAGMIWAAMSTFPGAAGPDGFDLSNEYNKVLRAEAQERALGWHVALRLEGGNRLGLDLTGPGGMVLPGAVPTAVAERPVGPKQERAIVFRAVGPGHFVAAQPLRRGRWDVLLTVRAAGHVFTTARRIIAEERRTP